MGVYRQAVTAGDGGFLLHRYRRCVEVLPAYWTKSSFCSSIPPVSTYLRVRGALHLKDGVCIFSLYWRSFHCKCLFVRKRSILSIFSSSLFSSFLLSFSVGSGNSAVDGESIRTSDA